MSLADLCCVQIFRQSLRSTGKDAKADAVSALPVSAVALIDVFAAVRQGSTLRTALDEAVRDRSQQGVRQVLAQLEVYPLSLVTQSS